MGIMLTDLANWCREAWPNVREYSGWQTRVRGGGPYSAMPLAVMWHHTASPASWDGQKDADYIAKGDSDAPLSNLYIDRTGCVWVIAAGPTNTNGKGGPMTFSRGTVPADGMNSRGIGVEMGNDGVGEAWPQIQVDAMFAISNVCNAKCGNKPTDISSHNAWAPTRKIDPARYNAVQGPWKPRGCNSSGTWNLDDMRAECTARAGAPGPTPPTPLPPNQEGASMPTGLWQMTGYPQVYVLYSGGYKVWCEDPAMLARTQDLLAISGVNNAIRIQTDPDMFKAFGPIVGPIPPGVNAWGL